MFVFSDAGQATPAGAMAIASGCLAAAAFGRSFTPDGAAVVNRTGLARAEWGHMVSILAKDGRPYADIVSGTGDELAQHVAALLERPDGPALVFIQELDSTEGRGELVRVAAGILGGRPDLAARWGVLVATSLSDPLAETRDNIDYGGPFVEPALDAVMAAGGHVGWEMYVGQGKYVAKGGNLAAGDAWTRGDDYLQRFFMGDPTGVEGGDVAARRFAHLAARRPAGSPSRLFPVFDVGDAALAARGGDGVTTPERFLDRLFYVWSRSGFRGHITDENGGVGAWKFHAPRTGHAG